VRLHDQSGGTTADIVDNYPRTLYTAEYLGAISGAGLGSWTVHIADTKALDTGTLNTWTLHLHCL